MSVEYFVDIQHDHAIDHYQAARVVIGNDDQGNAWADRFTGTIIDKIAVQLSVGFNLLEAVEVYKLLVASNKLTLQNGGYIRLRMKTPEDYSVVLAFTDNNTSLKW